MYLPVIGFSKIPLGVVCTIACVPSSISNSRRIFRGITTCPFTVKDTVSLFVEFFISQKYAKLILYVNVYFLYQSIRAYQDDKSTGLNSSHLIISFDIF